MISFIAVALLLSTRKGCEFVSCCALADRKFPLRVFFRTAPECTIAWTCTPWRAPWLTSCELSRIRWKVRFPFPFCLCSLGWGGGSCSCGVIRCRGGTDPLPLELCCFSKPAYFLPAETLILLPPAAHLQDFKALILLLLNLGSTQIWLRSGKQEQVETWSHTPST